MVNSFLTFNFFHTVFLILNTVFYFVIYYTNLQPKSQENFHHELLKIGWASAHAFQFFIHHEETKKHEEKEYH